MTGKQKSTREKFSAIFFAFVMVTSVVAIGSAAFAGTAAADAGSIDNSGLASTNTEAAESTDLTFDLETSTNDDNVQRINVDFEKGDNTNFEGNNGDLAPDGLSTGDVTVRIDTDGDGNFDFSQSPNDVTVNSEGNITIELASQQTINGDGNNNDIEVSIAGIRNPDDEAPTYDALVTFDPDTSDAVVDGSGNAFSTGESPVLTVNDNSATISSTSTRDEGVPSGPPLADGPDSETPSADNGQVDQVVVTFDQRVDDSTVDFEDFVLDDATNNPTIDSVHTGTTQDDNTLVLELQEDNNDIDGGSNGDTGVTNLDLSIDDNDESTANSLQDLSATAVGTVADNDVADGAAPVFLDLRKTADSTVTASFSETVRDDDNSAFDGETAGTPDIEYIDNNGAGATSLSVGGADAVPSGSSIALTTDNTISSNDINTDQVRFINIEDEGATPIEQLDDGDTRLIQNPSGFSLNGDSNNQVSTDIGGSDSQNLRAGSADQDLNLIRIKDISGSGSPLAARTIFRMPDGVTINESATNVLATTTTGGLEVDSTSIVDDSTLRIEHSGSSENGQILRVSGVAVDVAPDVSASQSGIVNDITVDFATGNINTGLLTVEKPQLQTGTVTISAGAEDQDLSIDPIVVQTGTNTAGQIANNTNIVISSNASNGVTFNTDTDPTTLVATTTGNLQVDMSSATLTADELTVPVTAHADAGDQLDINPTTGDSLDVDATGDASNAKLSATVVANDTTGDITTESSNNNPDITVDKPVVDIGNGDASDPADSAAVGATASDVGNNENFLSVGGAPSHVIEVRFQTSNPLSSGSDIVIRTNKSDVSFDTNAGTNLPGNDAPIPSPGNDDNTVDAAFETDAGSESVNSITINENEIVIDVSNPGDVAGTSVLQFDNLPLDVSSSLADGEKFGLVVETQPAPGTTVTATTEDSDPQDDFFEVDRPDLNFNNNNNATFNVDADGENNNEIDPGAGAADGNPAQNALIITTDDVDGQIGADSTVVVQLESGTGVTFDRSVNYVNTLNDDSETGAEVTTGGSSVASGDAGVSIPDRRTLEIDIDSNAFDGDDVITVDELFVNATGSAANTEVTVTTTTTSDNDITTQTAAIIEPNSVDPNNLFVNANVDETPGDGSRLGNEFGVEGTDAANTDITVGESAASTVFVEDGGSAFGGATVNFEIGTQPDGSSFTASQLLNTTSGTTSSSGTTGVEFSAPSDAETGDYIINATTATGFQNITYTVSPGSASQLNVTKVENAIAGANSGNLGDVGEAVLRVRIEDSAGNIVSTDIDAGLVIGGSATDSSFAADFTRSDGTSAGVFTGTDTDNDGRIDTQSGSSGTQGVFFVGITDQTEETVSVDVTAESSAVASGSAELNFYTVRGVNVSLNESTGQINDVVEVSATPTDGTTNVDVPRLGVSFSLTNSTVGSLDVSSSQTDANGTAIANLTADQTGETDVEALSRNKQGVATLTVGEAQVALSNVNLVPNSVDSNTTNNHDLTFDVSDMSTDDTADTFTIEFPDGTLDSANDVTVTDNNGADVSLSGGPTVSGDTLTFNTTASRGAASELSVDVNATVSVPVVAANTTEDISINITDSANGADETTTTLTITAEERDEQQPPTATIRFDDQSVQNGSTSVDVASARFDGTEDFVIVVHRASPGDNGVVDGTDEIGNKIGSSDVLSGNVSNVSVDLTKNLDEDGNTQLTENQTLIAMLHFANPDATGDQNFGNPITRGGSPVFDQANITITQQQQEQTGAELAAEFDENGDNDGVLDPTELLSAIDAFRTGEIQDPTKILDIIGIFQDGGSIET